MNKQTNKIKNNQKQRDSKISHQTKIYLGGKGGNG